MLPAPQHLLDQISWQIDGNAVDLASTSINTSYMGRGQSRYATALYPFSLSVDQTTFLSIIQDWYGSFLEDEKNDQYYTPAEDWAADLLRAKNFPTLKSLWQEAPHDVGRLLLEYETDFLDLIQLPSGNWKPNNYFVHHLERFTIDKGTVSMHGTCIHAPDHIKNLLNNLITNISDFRNTEQIMLDSLLALQKGHRYALPAIPHLRILLSHPNKKVSQTAQNTLDMLKGL